MKVGSKAPRRQGVFRPTTQDMPAVDPSPETRRRILVHVITKITADVAASEAIVDGALRDFGADHVPDDDDLYEVFVRSYLVVRMMPHGSVGAIAAIMDRLLA